MSAIAPAGKATTINGSIIAVWTRATMLAEFVSLVISHAAPTPRISCPKLPSRLALQIMRNVGSRKGARRPDFALSDGLVAVMVGGSPS